MGEPSLPRSSQRVDLMEHPLTFYRYLPTNEKKYFVGPERWEALDKAVGGLALDPIIYAPHFLSTSDGGTMTMG